MQECKKCGQLFIVKMDSCPFCNKMRTLSEQKKNKLLQFVYDLKKDQFITEDFKIRLNEIERILNADDSNNASG